MSELIDLDKLKYGQLELRNGSRWRITPKTFETKTGKFHCWWVFHNSIYPTGSLVKKGNLYACNINPKHKP